VRGSTWPCRSISLRRKSKYGSRTVAPSGRSRIQVWTSTAARSLRRRLQWVAPPFPRPSSPRRRHRRSHSSAPPALPHLEDLQARDSPSSPQVLLRHRLHRRNRLQPQLSALLRLANSLPPAWRLTCCTIINMPPPRPRSQESLLSPTRLRRRTRRRWRSLRRRRRLR